MTSAICACGCGKIISDREPNGRKTRGVYVDGHQSRGRKISEETKKKMSIAKMGKSMNQNEKNGQWKGDDIKSIGAIHRWLSRHLPKLDLCSICNIKPPYDIANINPEYNPETYTRDLKNWRWICRSCHMKDDGRMNNLKQFKEHE
jgi:hypothetical protein